MGTMELPKKPAAKQKAKVNPQKQAESLQQAVTRMAEEESGNVVRRLLSKLPPGGNERADAGDIREKLSRSMERHYREISGRLRAAPVQDDAAAGTRKTSAALAQLLRSLGGSDTFPSGDIGKPAAKKTAGDLEAHASSILRQKAGTPPFSYTDTSVTIVKCRFRDNALRPKTVTDVKLAVNITDSELISPALYDYAEADYLIKSFISRYIMDTIDRGVDGENIGSLLSDIDKACFDLANVRENISKSVYLENARTGGFNRTLNRLAQILEQAKLDYQCIENTGDGRELVIREYDDSDPASLPDERYALRLRYLDEKQLADDRAAYDAQLGGFEQKVRHLRDLIEVNYHDSKPVFKVNDYEDLAKKNKGRIRDLLKKTGGAPAQEISPEPVDDTFARMHERIKNMYEFLYPAERRIMEDQLDWLEGEKARLDFQINPHQVRAGLLIDAEITAIKRRKATLHSMAVVLGELARGVYACFIEAATLPGKA